MKKIKLFLHPLDEEEVKKLEDKDINSLDIIGFKQKRFTSAFRQQSFGAFVPVGCLLMFVGTCEILLFSLALKRGILGLIEMEGGYVPFVIVAVGLFLVLIAVRKYYKITKAPYFDANIILIEAEITRRKEEKQQAETKRQELISTVAQEINAYVQSKITEHNLSKEDADLVRQQVRYNIS